MRNVIHKMMLNKFLLKFPLYNLEVFPRHPSSVQWVLCVAKICPKIWRIRILNWTTIHSRISNIAWMINQTFKLLTWNIRFPSFWMIMTLMIPSNPFNVFQLPQTWWSILGYALMVLRVVNLVYKDFLKSNKSIKLVTASEIKLQKFMWLNCSIGFKLNLNVNVLGGKLIILPRCM